MGGLARKPGLQGARLDRSLPIPHPGPALRNPRLDLESRREFAEEYMTFLLPGSASNIQTRNRSTESS